MQDCWCRCDSILKLHKDFSTLDKNDDALTFPITLDKHLRRLKFIYQIIHGAREEIGHDCSCPVLTLYSARKYTSRLAFLPILKF